MHVLVLVSDCPLQNSVVSTSNCRNHAMRITRILTLQRHPQQSIAFRQSIIPLEPHYYQIVCFSLPAKLEQISQLCTSRRFLSPPSGYYLIRNYIDQRSFREAFVLYKQIRLAGSYELSIVPLLFKACASLSFLEYGKALHAEAIKAGSESDVMIGTSLISAYTKCGVVLDSRKLFETMLERNVVTWNAMINGYFRSGDTKSASLLFDKMSGRTEVTWIQMIDGFARNGDTVRARQIFDMVPSELMNGVTWTVMVDGYARNGEVEAAREIFEQMPDRNFFVWSSMIYGYCKKGNVREAKALFDRTRVRNLEIWNSMISGYAQNGFGEEALKAFREMETEGFEPDEFTVVSILSACSQLGRLDAGKEIHHMIKHKKIRMNSFILSGLINMYAQCGDLINARLIFEEFNDRNIYCWNAMLSGFAINRKCHEVLELFIRMEDSNVSPDGITFLTLLSACAHGGFVNEALEVISKMETSGLEIGIKHYGCMVDLLGRAGRLKEAYELMKRMPVKPNAAVLGAMLGACRIHSDMKMAEQVMQEFRAQNLDTVSGGNSRYVIMSNIYAASETWEKAERMRMVMANGGSHKIPGCSSVMFSGSQHQVGSVAN